MTSFSAELLSMYPARFLEHREAELTSLRELAETWMEFPDKRPVAVEIGANRGAFLVGMAKTWAPRPVLGIEWKRKFMRLAEARLAKHELENASMITANARLAIPTLFPQGTLEAVFVTFPDPWWKDKHVARRVLDPIFMRVIARRLAPRGHLYVKSDVFDYLYRVRAFAEVSGALRPLPPEHWPDESSWTLTTRERKCMQGAIPFGRGYYSRRADFDDAIPDSPEAAEDFPVDESDIDPTSIIRGVPPVDKEAHLRSGYRRGRRNR